MIKRSAGGEIGHPRYELQGLWDCPVTGEVTTPQSEIYQSRRNAWGDQPKKNSPQQQPFSPAIPSSQFTWQIWPADILVLLNRKRSNFLGINFTKVYDCQNLTDPYADISHKHPCRCHGAIPINRPSLHSPCLTRFEIHLSQFTPLMERITTCDSPPLARTL